MRWRSGELSHGRIAMLDLSFKFNMSHRGQFFLRVEFNEVIKDFGLCLLLFHRGKFSGLT